ncbi:Arc family DNA-binding protein [Xinfangfangia sp. D13-10-4-6]|uniref:Arc family DNA-binding protein n=1 Tax=Pseudogemmobacter hezensis TaxID=2737662 RepID=UPI001557B437|nr:Arc family DNA-binding protein [Pseudogemmobacter hezensis]NPD17607.1 Arc family DNA-binding protein [Pseudogemmobacter hezensis]
MVTIQSRSGEGDVVSYTIRMPSWLREEMKKQASEAGRSMNTHFVKVLSAAAGGEIGVQAPAAEVETAA